MSKYRENPLITPFSMLCPGISQNTKHHHLTLYKGQVWGEKSYLELCNHNILNIVYDGNINHGYQEVIYHGAFSYIHQNGDLYVPPAPGYGFINDRTQIPWDTEILQSFAWLTDITNINFYYVSQEDATYQIRVIQVNTKINKVDLDNSEKDLKTGELAESKSDCHGNPFIPPPTNHHH